LKDIDNIYKNIYRKVFLPIFSKIDVFCYTSPMQIPLNKEQEAAINHPGGPLLMAAGAGSGKTRALTGRLKALISKGVPPHEIIAITFTNKAAKEMRERVFGRDNADQKWHPRFPVYGEPFIGTFHSLGARILKQEAEHFKRTPSFTIYDSDDSLSLIKKICKQMDLEKETFKPSVVASRISSAKSELKDISTFFESSDRRDQIFSEIFSRYERALAENNAFDFDDLIEKPVRLIQENQQVREHYQKLFTQVLVDEYQDINTAQYQLIRLLADKHHNVSVVGDDAQAIYAFRGADFRNFLNFHRDWPSATIIRLEQNYRSSSNIITAASSVIGNNRMQTRKKLWTENAAGEAVKVVAAEDPDTEAYWAAGEIAKLRRANKNVNIAILYRTNAQSRAIEQALISENVPYKIYGGLKFYDRKEIKDVLAGLRLAANPSDSVSAERLQKSFGKRLGATVIEAMRGKNLPAVELITLFISVSNYNQLLEKDFNNPEERVENIAELINFASSFTSLEEFLERAALLQSTDSPSGQLTDTLANPVNLMTIHIAKGLEFDYVFVIGCNEGVLPHERSMVSEDQVEEERRLMYVAMTRARHVLYLLFNQIPSRFLYEVPKELCEFISPSGRMDALPTEDDMWLEQ
jgi:DNA helicase-2/ATP-dependent DNA helicase PcrA